MDTPAAQAPRTVVLYSIQADRHGDLEVVSEHLTPEHLERRKQRLREDFEQRLRGWRGR